MSMPPLLLAAALAFWGWRSGHYAAAGALAVLAEAPRWVSVRFDLRHADLERIASLSTALFVGLLIWLFMSIEEPRTARAVLTSLLWLPAVLAPILLAQQLSSSGRIPLSTLFRYLRKQRERDPTVPDPAVDVRGVYLAICLVAAGIPNQRDQIFYVVVVLLVAWSLAVMRPKHAAWSVWGGTLLAAACLGFAAHRGLGELQAALEDWISEWYVGGAGADPYRSSTDLGSVGRLKMIESIVLRVYASPEDAQRLKLLHRASFTSLHGKTWVARNAQMMPLEPQADGTTWRIATGEAETSARIVTRLDGGKALLALPAGTMRVSGMAAAAVKRNPLGAVMAELGGDWAPYVAEVGGAADDYAPPRLEDRQLPEVEREEFERLAGELGLKELGSVNERLQRVREHLATFAYATYREAAIAPGSTPLGDFLRRSKSGHCEYFAGAATLLLRAAGVPARYATGFAMLEYSALEEAYVVRARHAHAWTRAFVDGRWVDLDATPPSWIEEEDRGAPAWEKLVDLLRWAGFRWSQRGPLQGGMGWYAALALLIAVFTWRMLRGKRARQVIAPADSLICSASRGADSEFYAVENLLRARVGVRADGEPLAAWVTRAAPALDDVKREMLARAFALHNRYRFDPQGLVEAERGALRAHCLALARTLD